MEKVKFEIGRDGKIISRSLGKIGFPGTGWSPRLGEDYWATAEEKTLKNGMDSSSVVKPLRRMWSLFKIKPALLPRKRR